MPRPVSLSPELLQTFISVVAHGGDAVAAAEELEINQPSMSKRLAQLQHTGRVLRFPWLERRGKTWHLTKEGTKVLPTVEDLVHRYEQLRRFADSAVPPGVAIACGQEAAGGVVLDAWRRFRKNNPDHTIRISSMRGEDRIVGVASGLFELALVTHTPEQVHKIARRDLHVEELLTDPLVLVAAPHAMSAPVAEAFARLPESKVSAKALIAFPLVLPDPKSGLRGEFDLRMREEGCGAGVQAAVETGGWRIALEYVREGFGVGLIPKSLAEKEMRSDKEQRLVMKLPHPKIMPANTVRLICRRRFDAEGGLDLSDDGEAFRSALHAAAEAKATG